MGRPLSLCVLLGLAAVAASSCNLMTDAATRLARDLERQAGRLRSSQETTRVFEHRPVSAPEGCQAGFDLTLRADGDIEVHCSGGQRPGSGTVYTTTYHLRFVKVPRALNVSTRDGARIRITLTKQGDEIVVDALDTVR